MISNYLKTKNIIQYLTPPINCDQVLKNNSDGYYYLNSYPHPEIYYYYENLFTVNELNLITTTGNKLPIENAYVDNQRINPQVRDSTVSWIGVNSETEWIYEKLTNCICEVNEVHYKYDLEKLENLQFTRYFGTSNGFYSPHLDTRGNYNPSNRKLSMVLQLSDPSEYEGGELRLHLGSEPTIVKKQKGLITFFPSYVLHECTPITRGQRYVIVGWIHGPPFK